MGFTFTGLTCCSLLNVNRLHLVIEYVGFLKSLPSFEIGAIAFAH